MYAVGILHHQNGILGSQTDEHDERNLHIYIIYILHLYGVCCQHGGQRSCYGCRHAEQDGYGQGPALIQSRQSKIYKYDRYGIHHTAATPCLGLLVG